MRLIDADDLRDEMLEDDTFDNDVINYFVSAVDNASIIDAAPVVHGQWNDTYKSGHMPFPRNVCSVCDCWGERRSDYCSNCGARMGGDVK